MDTGRQVEARSDYDRAIALLSSIQREQTDEPNCRQDLAHAFINRGLLHEENHRPKKAAKDYHDALEHLRWLRKQAPGRVAYKYDLAIALQNWGYLQASEKQYDDARSTQQEALTILQELVSDFSTRPRYRKKLANSLNILGLALYGGGDPVAAEKCWRQACDLITPLLDQVPDPTDYRGILGYAQGNLGWLEASKNHLPEARRLLEPAIAHLQAALLPGVQRADYQQALKNNARNLAEVCVQLRDHAAAVEAANLLVEGTPKQAQDSYNAACFIARSVPLARDDPHLNDEPTRRLRVERYAARALSLLREALADPSQKIDRIPEDTKYFSYLAGHPGFAEAMADLNAKTVKP
jgi:tetratricopeptide (TPR) repeat protein